MGEGAGEAVSPCCFGITSLLEIVPRATPSETGEPRVSSGLAWRDKQSTRIRGLNNKKTWRRIISKIDDVL